MRWGCGGLNNHRFFALLGNISPLYKISRSGNVQYKKNSEVLPLFCMILHCLKCLPRREQVSLVAVMDADKEGFLRSDHSLIQVSPSLVHLPFVELKHCSRPGTRTCFA